MATDYKNLYIYFGRTNGKSTYSTNVIERIAEEMTMDQMVRNLERRGFLVIKEYDGRSGSYIFTITKGGVTYSEDFKYPISCDWRYKDEKQKEFLKNIVENFYIYMTRKEEEKEMNNTWKVASATNMGKGLNVVLYNDKVENIGVMDIQNCLDTIKTALNRGDPNMRNAYTNCYKCPKPNIDIKDVIFNPPATIVFWKDGTKTVVKAGEHDIYDPEKGLAMAITKKVLGNQGSYYNEIRKWVKPYEDKIASMNESVILDIDTNPFTALANAIYESLGVPIGTVKNIEQTEEGVKAEVEVTDEKWKIWFEKLNDFDEVYGYDVYPTEYKHKSSALRRAKQMFNGTGISWAVSKTDPWGDPVWQE